MVIRLWWNFVGACVRAYLQIDFPASARSERTLQFYIMYLGEGVPKRCHVFHLFHMSEIV
jgi:hypothetical protein